MEKIYEDNKIILYKFTITNDTKYEDDVFNVHDYDRILSYDDTIIDEDGNIHQFFYIPKQNKNSVFILCDLKPDEEKEFIIIKRKEE